MKKLYSLIVTVAMLTVSFGASAQSNNNNSGSGFDQLIKSNSGDALKLVQAFAEPLFKGFGIGLNSGWNNTAKTKKLLHFDLRVTGNIAQVPTADRTFDVTNIGLSSHVTLDKSSPTKIAQTFAGDKNAATPLLDINDNNGNKVSSFTMPNGVIKYIPAPNIQLTVGVLKNTDLTIRTTPSITVGSNGGSVGMIGFGLKHDLIQDFAKKVPKPFDLAIAVNYNRLNYNVPLTVNPDAGTAPAPGSQTDFSNQKVKGTFSGTNVQAIISKKLLFFTPFLAVAYQTANTNFGVLGNYPVTSSAGVYTTISNPVSINENSVSGFRTDVGFQLNLAVFRLYLSYSPGSYQSVNGGIGLGF